MPPKFAETSAQLGFPTPKDPSAYVDCLAGVFLKRLLMDLRRVDCARIAKSAAAFPNPSERVRMGSGRVRMEMEFKVFKPPNGRLLCT